MAAVGSGVHQGLASSFEDIVARNARLGGFSYGDVYPSSAEATNTAEEARRLGATAVDAAAARHGSAEMLRDLGGAATVVSERSGRLAIMSSNAQTFGDWRGTLDGPVDAIKAALASQPGTARPLRDGSGLIDDIGTAIRNVSNQNGLLHAYSNRDIYPSSSMGETGRKIARDVSDIAIDLAVLDPASAPTAQRIMDGARKIGSNAGRMGSMSDLGSTFGSWSGAYDDALRALQDGLSIAAKLR